MRFGEFKIPVTTYMLLILYLVLTGIFTPNLFITLPLVFFPIFAIKLFWIPGHLNVLFWGMMMQWLSIFAILFYCNILGVTQQEFTSSINAFAVSPKMMDYAVFLSTIGIYSFSIGIYLGISRLKISNLNSQLKYYSVSNVLKVYVIISFFIYFLTPFIWAFPGFVQYLHHLFLLKWGFFTILFHMSHATGNNRFRNYTYLIIVSEFVIGLSSFFASSFITVLLFSIFSLVSTKPKLTTWQYLFTLLIAGFIFHIAVLWTAVKSDYREFANQGSIQQAVKVSRKEATGKLFEIVGNVDQKAYDNAIKSLIYRVGYVYYFSLTLDYIPRVTNYENGKIYLSALLHYVQPRFLFPEKENLDDSKHTSKYTGVHFNGAKEGVSFSLGYVADAYIDFGPIGMFFILMVFGNVVGNCYRFLYENAPNTLWAWVFTAPFFFLVNIYGADTKKALGALLIYMITILFLKKTLIKLIDPRLKAIK